MARWKLTAAHYLKTDPPTEWDYKEVDRKTGRPITRRFIVPALFDPKDPTAWTQVDGFDEGIIVVTDKLDPNHPRDVVAFGLPTLDMEPLDDEAREKSTAFAKAHPHPIETLPGNFSDNLLTSLQNEFAKAASATSGPQSTQIEGMGELLAAITTMMKQNQELLKLMVGNPAQQPASTMPAPNTARRA